MKTYAQFLMGWIEETEQCAEYSKREYLASTDPNVALIHRNRYDNEMELVDDLCDVLHRKTGKTYLQHMQEAMDAQFILQHEEEYV